MARNTDHSHRSNPRTRTVASWAGVAVALVASGALATTVMAGGPSEEDAPAVESVGEPYVDCLRSVGGSPDSLEHWVDTCSAIADAIEQRFLSCMHDVGGTADSLERRAAECGQQALAGQRP